MIKSIIYVLISLVILVVVFAGTEALLGMGIDPLLILLGVCLIFVGFIWEFRSKPGEHPWDMD